MSKHTPGPWVWTPDAETIHGYSPEGEARVVVYELGTNEPDARLIAAAPELLEALQGMVDYYGTASANVDALFNARKTIAKATGANNV